MLPAGGMNPAGGALLDRIGWTIGNADCIAICMGITLGRYPVTSFRANAAEIMDMQYDSLVVKASL